VPRRVAAAEMPEPGRREPADARELEAV
jgi:hypothetical protein